MIDREYKVRRYISEFSEATGELIVEYDLSNFDLEKFQNEFGEPNLDSPMFDSYQIKRSNIAFLKTTSVKNQYGIFPKNPILLKHMPYNNTLQRTSR
jgi:hypothetical protein